MVRTILYFFLAAIVLGTIAVPGLGAFALVLAPLGLGLIWRFALTAETRGQPGAAIAHTKPSHLLGPEGPDDSFAAYDLDEAEYPPEASSRSKAA
jgi:hypothetical protein